MTRFALLLAAAAGLAAPNSASAAQAVFDPARAQATQTTSVEALQTANEHAAQAEQARRRAAAARPGQAGQARAAALARAQTPEGRMEAQAEVARDDVQPRVDALAARIRRDLRVQPDRTGRAQAARVEAAEREARSDVRRQPAPGG